MAAVFSFIFHEELGILRQISKGRRNRRFMYQEYVTILSEGTELVAAEQ
jgi:hypothetical protein